MAKTKFTAPSGYKKADGTVAGDRVHYKDGSVWSLDGKTRLNADGTPLVDGEGKANANVTDETDLHARLAELEQKNAEQAVKIAALEAKDGRRKTNEGGKVNHMSRQMAGKYPAKTDDMPTVDEINKAGQT